MRARFRVTVVAAATTVMALPAAAQAPVAVEARPDNTFVPADVRIRTGEEVEWRNRGGFHNVVFDDGSYRQPPVPDPTSWTVRRRFDEPGTFSYVCQAHRDQGMRGTVTVLAPDDPAAPPPQPPPSPEPAPGPAPDESPAAARLSRVRVLVRRCSRPARCRRAVTVRFRLDRDAEVTIRVTRRGSGTLRRVRRTATAGTTAVRIAVPRGRLRVAVAVRGGERVVRRVRVP